MRVRAMTGATKISAVSACCLVAWIAATLMPAGQPRAASLPGQTIRWTFGSDPIGGLPRGAVVFSGTWAVRTDPGAPGRARVL